MLLIRGTQTDPDGESLTSENRQKAFLSSTEKGYELYYDQSEDGEAVRCRLILEQDRLVIRRAPGLDSGGLVMLAGTEQSCEYVTAYGTLPVRTRTASVRLHSGQRKIHAKADYELCMGDYVISASVFIVIELPE